MAAANLGSVGREVFPEEAQGMGVVFPAKGRASAIVPKMHPVHLL